MENALSRFQELLRRLFQFDGAELDFGIYRILNYKREQIEQFITQRLPQIVDEAFASYAETERNRLEQELQNAREEIRKVFGEHALDEQGNLRNYHNTKLGQQYTLLLEQRAQYQVSEDLKIRVYNDLYNFFARYYEDGDFISKRRYGRHETYAVPYNGEEVMLHWATKDQYYIKTGERLKNYRFLCNGYSVAFELRNASTEQNNNRGEKRYFILASKQPVVWNASTNTLTCFFEYRPLTEDEQKIYGSTEQQKPQEKLNEEIARTIIEQVPDPTLRALLQQAERDGEPARLLKHLTRFTRRNTSDFFIHKDLRGFLQRELEFYIKSECLRLDELLNAPDAQLAQQHLQRGRVMREIGNHIIDFLAQIEEFQKKLFEKKKFILRTDYCITIGQIPGCFWDEILQNEAQINEWRELYALDDLLRNEGPFNGGISHDFLRQHPTLVVDTRHFSEDFKWRLLEAFDDLDDAIDGVLIHSENFQALNLLLEKYRERIKCIYIDPPYNTGSDDFIYKDAYQHSSWLSMMADRLALARECLEEDGSIFINIDENEQPRLRLLLEYVFGAQNYVAPMVWISRAGKGGTGTKIQVSHEHVELVAKNESLLGLKPTERIVENCPYQDEKGPYRRELLRQWGEQGARREDRPSLYFPIPTPFGDAYPKLPDGSEGRWRYGREEVKKMLEEGDLDFVRDPETGEITVYRKIRMGQRLTSIPGNLLSDVGTSADGTKAFKALFGEKSYGTPKPVELISHLVELITWNTPLSTVLDFFAGSGTTGHAVINLNRADGGRRKFILVEMGDYFDSVLVARLKKVVFAPEWKDGKPKRLPTQEEIERTPRILKVLRLESYEDALNNLELRRQQEGQQAFETFGDEYLLRYMLEFETQGSPSLLDIEQFEEPFEYKLKVYQGDALVEHPVDLVETFNYLLGLEVRRMRAFENGGRPYRAVLGEKGGRRIVVVWRPLKELRENEAALKADKDYIEKTILPALLGEGVRPDQLYVNGVCAVETAQPIEPEFKRLMFGGTAQ